LRRRVERPGANRFEVRHEPAYAVRIVSGQVRLDQRAGDDLRARPRGARGDEDVLGRRDERVGMDHGHDASCVPPDGTSFQE
jgi:hypothetical protein